MFAVKNPARGELGRLARGLELTLGAPVRLTAPDPSRLVIWAPAAFGAGAAAYFSLSFEPAPVAPWLFLVSALISAGAGAVWRRHPAALYAGVGLAAFLLGLAATQARVTALAPPDVERTERARLVEGWIERVERGGARPRLLIRVSELEGAENAPFRIRVRAGLGDFTPGDPVRFRAVLGPPPAPSAPGAMIRRGRPGSIRWR